MSLKLGTTDISGVPTTLINTVNNKLDASTYMSNPRTNAVYITETYHNGTSWYRVWSDGFIEQGGVLTSSGFVTFLKPYSNNNFTCVFNRHYPRKTTSHTSSTTTANRNTIAGSTQYGSIDGTGVYLPASDENGCDGIRWYACGY